MGEEILCKIAADMLSIPPLVFRIVRKKLIKTTLEDLEADIKFPHFEILRLLDKEGTMHVARIGEQLEIAKAQMTHLLDRLVELDLVAREMDTADRRTINISLTDNGREVVAAHSASILNAIRDKMSYLNEGEIEEMYNSLRTVRDMLMKLES